ncbi:metallophosphoesterase [Massilia sp. W12]|uniref:metallophosphoesterase family protein n=1 Tax=Massilia sp. W12 TaxID=3126507 RepID=UPI0030CD0595
MASGMFRVHTSIPALLGATLVLSACVSTPPGAPRGLPDVAGAGAQILYVAGDIADCRRHAALQSPAAATAALIEQRLARDPQAQVLTLGDNAYVVASEAELRDCYAPTWGRFLQRTWAAAGNHEYYSKDALPYYAYFGAQAGPAGLGYYRKTFKGWQLYALNSNLKGEAMQRQLDWLRQEIQQNPARCSLAYWHHPRYSSGGHGNDQRMQQAWQILQDAGAELVLAGHDHDYERFAPQDANGNARPDGIAQFVVGTGGTRLSSFLLQRPHSQAAFNDAHGVLQLVLRENGYDWQFLTTDGALRDIGSRACH